MSLGVATRSRTAAYRNTSESITTPLKSTQGGIQTGAGSAAWKSEYDKACKYFSASGLMDAQAPCNPATIAKAIDNLAGLTGLNVTITKSLRHLSAIVAKTDTSCDNCSGNAKLSELLEEFKVDFQLDLENKMESFGRQMDEKFATQGQTSVYSDKLEETAKNLNAIAMGLGAKLDKVTDFHRAVS
jgi:hypothetical protein